MDYYGAEFPTNHLYLSVKEGKDLGNKIIGLSSMASISLSSMASWH